MDKELLGGRLIVIWALFCFFLLLFGILVNKLGFYDESIVYICVAPLICTSFIVIIGGLIFFMNLLWNGE